MRRAITAPSHSVLMTAAIVISLALAALPVLAQENEHAQHQMAAGTDASTTATSMDEHAAHRAMMSNSANVRIERVEYTIPDLTLQDETGQAINVKELLASGRPLAVNFIFTTCTTICPVMTATMMQLGRELTDDPNRPAFVSISIDPSYDSAEVLKSYAERYGADWTFLTGASDDVLRVLQAFDAYRGSKVNHFALTLLRAGDSSEWTRVEGLTSAQELARIWKDISS
jgi:protein SCO1